MGPIERVLRGAPPLKPGDDVDVYKVWAGGREVSEAWFGGYVLVAVDEGGKSVTVCDLDYNETWWHASRVRPSTGCSTFIMRREQLRRSVADAERAFAEALS